MPNEPQPAAPEVRVADTMTVEIARAAHRHGVAIMLLSAVVFSTAGLFTKGVSADAWTIVFWRGVFAALLTTAYVARRGRMAGEFRRMGRPGATVAVVGAAGTAAFIASFKLTTIANVSLIYATCPFLAAALAWVWFREKPSATVMAASALALAGVAVIVDGSLGGVSLRGDMLALWMTAMLAIIMVIYRRYPATPSAGPAVLSSLLLLPFGIALGDPFGASQHEIAIMAAFGLVFAVASVTMAEGARRLPPGEASLISAMETPLAPLWAWLLFTEIPAVQTVIGGILILIAVFSSQIRRMRRGRVCR